MTSPALLKPPRAADKTPNQGDVNIRWVDVADAISRMFCWSYGGDLAVVGLSMMGCETCLNGAAGPFHRGYFSGISIVMVSNMSNAQKVAMNRSDDMPILVRGPTTWQRLMVVIIRSTSRCGSRRMRMIEGTSGIPQSQAESHLPYHSMKLVLCWLSL